VEELMEERKICLTTRRFIYTDGSHVFHVTPNKMTKQHDVVLLFADITSLFDLQRAHTTWTTLAGCRK
jgi:hypothetical protein